MNGMDPCESDQVFGRGGWTVRKLGRSTEQQREGGVQIDFAVANDATDAPSTATGVLA
jgi:hypothetical protein